MNTSYTTNIRGQTDATAVSLAAILAEILGLSNYSI